MGEWRSWDVEAPEFGRKVCIVADDGSSTLAALMHEDGPFEAESMEVIIPSFLKGSIWTYLPQNYPIAFMEYHGD